VFKLKYAAFLISFRCGGSNVWIGLKDQSNEVNRLEWSDNSLLDWKNVRIDLNIETQRCVRMMMRSNVWEWWDIWCPTKYQFMCKKGINNISIKCFNASENDIRKKKFA
jgi:hypothetical protein